MPLVAGVDSSTQSCKVVVRDADTGELVREGRAPHPTGTAVPPAAWEAALSDAVAQAGGLDDVAAASIAGQMQGMVCLDADGAVIRDAVLWNDTRSAGAAADLISDLGGGEAGRRAWAEAVGLVPVASFTVTKLRWLASAEPDNAARTAAVCLPHDWLTWRLSGAPGLDALRTDRSEASGTGYWSAATGEYRLDLIRLAFGRDDVLLPQVLGPTGQAGHLRTGAPLGPGAGDCAAAALGAGAEPGDVIVSIGTSGIVSTVSDVPAADPSGIVAGFADMTGRFLPVVCTLNAARVLDAAATMLRVDHAELSALALSAPPGADGLVLVPYLEGERTPNRPHATGAVHGLTLRTSTAAHLARAAVEGMLCALADGLDAMIAQGTTVNRVILVGGGARSEAVRRIAPTVFGRPVLVPPLGEYVADGAARQAAWVLSGGERPPSWTVGQVETHEADPVPAIRERYAVARENILDRAD
ncbi:xylulose kinase [Microbispora cellulosiformans]|uniref:Xylulose kinase n=1 Tax=Microbispora cellulosiformans TaxID=2614688 RepID=A0A5J5K2N6_9ACTN|nr:FGGY family carbohydrate kinase [Microbispora cellulosiformans]KAA9378224.1 xylulose kinase [Microbispora cellulosiformans]